MEKMISLYEQGVKLKDMPSTPGPAFYAELERRGIPRRNRPWRSAKVATTRPILVKTGPLTRALEFGKLYNAGATYQAIADMQNPPITRERVRQILRKYDIPSLGHRKREYILTDREKQILADYDSGMQMPDILAKHNVKTARLHYLRRLTKHPRRRWRIPEVKARDEEAFRLYRERPDLRIQDIGEMLGYNNPSGILTTMRRHGIPRTRNGSRGRHRVDRERVKELVGQGATAQAIATDQDISKGWAWQLKKKAELGLL